MFAFFPDRAIRVLWEGLDIQGTEGLRVLLGCQPLLCSKPQKKSGTISK